MKYPKTQTYCVFILPFFLAVALTFLWGYVTLSQFPMCQNILMGSWTINLKTLSIQRSFQCPACSVVCATNSEWTRHFRNHIEKNLNQCSKCSRVFSTKTTLSRHLRSHKGQKPFQCPQCDKAYSRKWTLQNHMQSQHQKRPPQKHKEDRPLSISSFLIEA